MIELVWGIDGIQQSGQLYLPGKNLFVYQCSGDKIKSADLFLDQE